MESKSTDIRTCIEYHPIVAVMAEEHRVACSKNCDFLKFDSGFSLVYCNLFNKDLFHKRNSVSNYTKILRDLKCIECEVKINKEKVIKNQQ